MTIKSVAGGSIAAGAVAVLGCTSDSLALAPSLGAGAAVLATCEIARRTLPSESGLRYIAGVCEPVLKMFAGVTAVAAGANYAAGDLIDPRLPFLFGALSALGMAVKLAGDAMEVTDEGERHYCSITGWPAAGDRN
jgi:hypothetical protein